MGMVFVMNKRILSLIIQFFLLVLSVFSRDEVIKLSNYSFYKAVYKCDLENIKLHIEKGFNPNKCRGEAGWVDSIPLKVLSEGLKGTYISRIEDPDFTYNNSDIKAYDLLIANGANINQLPYTWDRVYRYDNTHLENIEKKKQYNEAKKKLMKQYFVEDVNRLLEAMLSAGADPNMKGHPFPFSNSRYLLFFNNKKAFKYFNSPEATTPLYEAIKKGSDWESQVDLLLEYGAVLDASCLKAAELSGDEKMISKIRGLMKQNIK